MRPSDTKNHAARLGCDGCGCVVWCVVLHCLLLCRIVQPFVPCGRSEAATNAVKTIACRLEYDLQHRIWICHRLGNDSDPESCCRPSVHRVIVIVMIYRCRSRQNGPSLSVCQSCCSHHHHHHPRFHSHVVCVVAMDDPCGVKVPFPSLP